MIWHTPCNKIKTDENLMETVPHGAAGYAFECYFEKLSQFDFHCIEWHWHTELEFVYAESGSMTLWVGEKQFELSEGSGIFINSRVLHRFYSPDEAVIPNFLCMASFIAPENSLIYQKYIEPILSSTFAFQIFHHDISWQMEAISIMKQIFTIQNQNSVRELATSALMQKLWLTIYENTDMTQIKKQANDFSSAQTRLQLMMQYIHQNFSQDISLEEIANYAKISKSTALNLFHRFLHITPVNYLICYRLKEAALLLTKTEKKIHTISSETGFHNVDYFCRAFKQKYHMTPTEYRKMKQ